MFTLGFVIALIVIATMLGLFIFFQFLGLTGFCYSCAVIA